MQLTEHHRQIYDAPWIGGDDPGGDFDRHLADDRLAAMGVAMTDDRVVGLVGLLLYEQDGGPYAELEPLIVDVDHRGRGASRELVAWIADQARDRGCESLNVKSVARNAQALAAYKALGFGTVGYIELFQMLGDSPAEFRPGLEVHGLAFDV